MKRVWMVVLIGLGLLQLFGTEIAFAQEKNFYVTLGLKAWLPDWQTSFLNADPSFSGANITSLTSDPEVATIPSVSLKYKNLFVSGGYFLNKEFTFPEFSDRSTYAAPTGTLLDTYKVTAKREETDINLGYFVTPNLALSLGYKNISQEYHTVITTPGFLDLVSDSETKIVGPTVGIIGAAGIGGGLALYGNFSFGLLKAEYEGVSEKDNATYVSSELGVVYKIQDTPLSVSLGYKYQAIDTEPSDPDASELTGVDVTKGFIFGTNLTF